MKNLINEIKNLSNKELLLAWCFLFYLVLFSVGDFIQDKVDDFAIRIHHLLTTHQK